MKRYHWQLFWRFQIIGSSLPKTYFVAFHESYGLGPQALRAWFYPGDKFGQEFVYYPATLGHLLAKLANTPVTAETVDPKKGDLKSVPLVAVTPSGQEENITDAIQTTPDHQQAASENPEVPEAPRSDNPDRKAGQPETTFHAITELVVLSVSVTDNRGNFVSGLLPRDFRVYEDGQLQKITLFEREDVPVTVGLVVDHSRSMEGKLLSVSSATTSFAHSSNPNDEMFVVDFSDRVWPELFGGKLFTSDVKELEGALMSVAAQGETALYDAVYEGLARLQLANRDKKALIIVSDGGDNRSRHRYSEVIALARLSQAVIYSVGLVGASGEEENPRVLERLSQETGGLTFFPKTLDTVKQISEQIARDLRAIHNRICPSEKDRRWRISQGTSESVCSWPRQTARADKGSWLFYKPRPSIGFRC